MRGGPERDGQVRPGEVSQADMVEMTVREDEGVQITAAVQAGDGGMGGGIRGVAVERQAQVEQEASAVLGELDAAATNLLRAAMDANPHRLSEPRPTRYGTGRA